MFGIRSKLLHLRFAWRAARQHARTLSALRESGKTTEKVLFVCYGNICRSPVAEKLAQRLLPAMEVTSAGFYPEENRRSPENVQRAAESLGIDLSQWSSRRVTSAMVEHADLIVLFDLRNLRDFRRDFPNEQAKTVFLGLCLDPPQLNITDPYDKSADETERIVKQIEAGVASLARKITL